MEIGKRPEGAILSFGPGMMPESNVRYVKKPIPIRALQVMQPFEVHTKEGGYAW